MINHGISSWPASHPRQCRQCRHLTLASHWCEEFWTRAFRHGQDRHVIGADWCWLVLIGAMMRNTKWGTRSVEKQSLELIISAVDDWLHDACDAYDADDAHDSCAFPHPSAMLYHLRQVNQLRWPWYEQSAQWPSFLNHYLSRKIPFTLFPHCGIVCMIFIHANPTENWQLSAECWMLNAKFPFFHFLGLSPQIIFSYPATKKTWQTIPLLSRLKNFLSRPSTVHSTFQNTHLKTLTSKHSPHHEDPRHPEHCRRSSNNSVSPSFLPLPSPSRNLIEMGFEVSHVTDVMLPPSLLSGPTALSPKWWPPARLAPSPCGTTPAPRRTRCIASDAAWPLWPCLER